MKEESCGAEGVKSSVSHGAEANRGHSQVDG